MQATEVHQRDTYAFRWNLQESLASGHIDLAKLSAIQRILLITDGTLTKILEAYLHERLHVVKLSEHKMPVAYDIIPLSLKVGREVIERKIFLQGITTQNYWLYAESIIVPDRLDERFRERLLHTQQPIGRLWIEHKMETYKEIISLTRETAGDLAEYFNLKREDRLLCRTYRVFSNRKPIMMITEKFPENYFKLAVYPIPGGH